MFFSRFFIVPISLSSYSLLCLLAIDTDKTTAQSFDLLREKLVQIGVKSGDVRNKLVNAAEKHSTLVLLSKLGDGSNDFVSTHLAHSVGGKFELFGRDSGFSGSRLPNTLNEAEKILNVNFVVRNSEQVKIVTPLFRQFYRCQSSYLVGLHSIKNKCRANLVLALIGFFVDFNMRF